MTTKDVGFRGEGKGVGKKNCPRAGREEQSWRPVALGHWVLRLPYAQPVHRPHTDFPALAKAALGIEPESQVQARLLLCLTVLPLAKSTPS